MKVSDVDKCLRYTARRIRGVTVGESPLKIRSRLELVGLRSINNIVDITNYVMWELGLPLHAFDSAMVRGGIEVRRASENEKFTTLTGQDLELSADDLLIADGEKGIALAGVMGGENSGISPETGEVILEAALFEPVGVRKTSKRHGQKTDSSYRFERGLDFNKADIASARAADLMVRYGGADSVSGITDIKKEGFDPERTLELRFSRIREILGMDIPGETLADSFSNLGYKVEPREDGLRLTVPSVRYWDIYREIDLIEEAARFYGYDRIPQTLPMMKMIKGHLDNGEKLKEKSDAACLGNGFFETCTFPLISAETADLAGYDTGSLFRVSNPLNREMEYMTPQPVLGLLRVAELNLKRGADHVKVFENSRTFLLDKGEENVKVFLCTGEKKPSFHEEASEVGFYDVKGLAAELEGLLGEPLEEAAPESPLWEKGTAEAFACQGKTVLEYGAVKKKIAAKYDIKKDVWAGWFYTERALPAYNGKRSFVPFSQFPPVYYDLAFVVDKNVKAGELQAFISENSGRLLRDIYLFDLYEGRNVEEGKKSLAYSLEFRSDEKTLTEKEISAIIDKVVKKVSGRFDARLR